MSKVEKDTGIEFFPQLDGPDRVGLETSKGTKLW
jgi:hypothetical protein